MLSAPQSENKKKNEGIKTSFYLSLYFSIIMQRWYHRGILMLKLRLSLLFSSSNKASILVLGVIRLFLSIKTLNCGVLFDLKKKINKHIH